MKILVLIICAFGVVVAHADIGRPLEGIPIQDAGRIKPFGTFAQESLQLIYGKRTFENKPATQVVFTWLLIPDHWATQDVIEVRHSGLKEALKLPLEKKHFSAQALFTNPRIPLVIQELQTLRSRQEKLNPYFAAVQRLESQLALFQAIRTGKALRFIPSSSSETWTSVPEFDENARVAFTRVSKAFVDAISAAPQGQSPEVTPELESSVSDFIAFASSVEPSRYGDLKRVHWELHLNHFHPFKWAWIAYLVGLLCLLLHRGIGWRQVGPFSYFFLLIGFLLHGYGMGLRIYLAGRPPVSNMYETVVWVPWGAVLFGLILERVQKNKLLLGAAAGVAIFCLILTDLAPTVLDASIHPLEPVLRSTFWLSTHVLIITISYAAFFLAFAISDVLLYFYLKDEKQYAETIRAGTQSIYRSLQIGVVLLAFGIILGGIWADYSWGRFWGWDPKETWALIALLGYLALLHGRLVGWVRNYQLAVGSIIAFLLVIMAWYGVNMVLGAGLHTYGFGAGGVEYVLGFSVVHLLYVVYVTTVRYSRAKIPSK